jgi:acyl-CoA thioesterase FadM
MRNKTWRTDPGFHRFRYEAQLRYTDIDTERHINNVGIMTLHAEARTRFHLALFGREPWLGMTATLRSVATATDFLRISHYPAPLTVGVSLVAIGEDDYTLATAVFQEGACVGLQECRIGAWKDGRRIALPADVRSALQAAGVTEEPAQEPGGAPPALLNPAKAADIAAYPRVYPLSLRWTDLDADRCLSELAVARYAEQGRSELLTRALREVGIDIIDSGRIGMVVASVRIHHLSQRQAHGDIRLATGISRVGRSTVDLRIAVFDRDACLAVSDNVMVFLDRESGRPMPVPDNLLAKPDALTCDAA